MPPAYARALDRSPQAAAPANETILDGESASLTPQVMVGESDIESAIGGKRWSATTDNNSDGSGLDLPCQQERYADPGGTAALVRNFESEAGKGPARSAIQATELSDTAPAARRAFATTLGWYGGCTVERAQLISTRRVEGLGDQAMLVVLRMYDDPLTTLAVGVARTGQFTTTTATVVGNAARPDVNGNTTLLASAVSALCTLPEGGECSGTPKPRLVAPLPVGKAPAMLTELDLPPVTRIALPWVGTEPTQATTNLAATRCDLASFNGTFKKAAFSANWTRQFLIPEAELPAEFGLTETVATLPERRAKLFVEEVRRKLSTCEAEDNQLGTEVVQVANFDDRQTSLTAWQVTVQVSDKRSVDYTMAIMRRGIAVAQVSFVPAPRVQMADGAFVDLAYRALARLVEMPKPDATNP